MHNAREHNLKNVDVEVPRDRMTVITGVSGSGKSTLAFDVIFARTTARVGIAAWLPTQAAGHIAAARATPLRSKIVEIFFASVTFVTSHARFA